MSKVEIYTDGACKGNPGPGGWGAWLRFEEHECPMAGQSRPPPAGIKQSGKATFACETELFGGEALTTNNRMELNAPIQALGSLKRRCEVTIHTDSQYVRNGITTWIHNWKKRGWKTASNQPVKNVDLWLKLEELCQAHTVHWRWVKGHAGDPGNERADELANRGVALALG